MVLRPPRVEFSCHYPLCVRVLGFVHLPSLEIVDVVPQISGPSIVLLGSFRIPHQLANQPTAMDVSPTRGVDSTGCIEI